MSDDRQQSGGSHIRLWVVPYDDAVNGLLLPMLRSQTRIVRMSAYFTSGFIGVTRSGWAQFAMNGGVMRLICGPEMPVEDMVALTRGKRRMPRSEFVRLVSSRGVKSRRVLAAAAAAGVLEARIVRPSGSRMFHAKTGAAAGSDGGPVVWTGSANDTKSGWTANYEHVMSYHGPLAAAAANAVWKRFGEVWKGALPGYVTSEPGEYME